MEAMEATKTWATRPMMDGWTACERTTNHHGYADWETFTIRSKSNVCLAVVGAVDHLGSENNRKRADLMAAAPEMFEALERLEAGVRLWISRGVSDDDMAVARAALQKAKGGA